MFLLTANFTPRLAGVPFFLPPLRGGGRIASLLSLRSSLRGRVLRPGGRLPFSALPSGEGGRQRPGEGYTGWRQRRRVRVEEATFVRQSRFSRIRGALSTLIRHAKRVTFPKGEGKEK